MVSDIVKLKENNVDIILATIDGVNVCFTYVHPGSKIEDFLSIQATLTMSNVVIGDLNINTQDANFDEEKQLQRLGDQIGKKPVLNEITHQNLSQPDHILLGKDFGLPFYATSYKNMYRDHKSTLWICKF